MNLWKRASAVVPILAFGVLHCDNKKAATEQRAEPLAARSATSSGLADAAAPSASIDASMSRNVPAKDAGPAPESWYSCQKADDCVLVPERNCCRPCDPLEFSGLAAVNVKHKDDFLSHEGCADAKCPACPDLGLDLPLSSANFFVLCEKNRCVAADLRFSKYTKCAANSDCKLRWGLRCCDGCSDNELVTFNPKSSLLSDICPAKKPLCPPPSPECLAHRHSYEAECSAGNCQLAD